MRIIQITHSHKAKGFTLIELLIAMGIFTIIALFAVGAMSVIFESSRKSNSSRAVMTNLNFALENLSREIRFGQSYRCGGGAPDEPLSCESGDTEISFMFDEDDDGSLEEVHYRFTGTPIKLERKVGSGSWNNNGVVVISDEVTVDLGRFYVLGAENSDTDQARVIVVIEGEAGKSGSGTDTKFTVQNTLTQRIYDR